MVNIINYFSKLATSDISKGKVPLDIVQISATSEMTKYVPQKFRKEFGQLTSELKNFVIDNLPPVLKPFVANEQGVMSVRRLPNLIEFLENSDNLLLKKAADELKETGKISSFGSKMDFENYARLESIKSQYGYLRNYKPMLNFDILQKIITTHNLFDEHIRIIFIDEFVDSCHHSEVSKFINLVKDPDIKQFFYKSLLNKTLRSMKFIPNFLNDLDNDTLKDIVKSFELGDNTQKQKFLSLLESENMPLNIQVIIGKFFDDATKADLTKKALREIDNYNEKQDYLKLLSSFDGTTDIDLIKKAVNKISNYYSKIEKIDLIELVESIQDISLRKKVIIDNNLTDIASHNGTFENIQDSEYITNLIEPEHSLNEKITDVESELKLHPLVDEYAELIKTITPGAFKYDKIFWQIRPVYRLDNLTEWHIINYLLTSNTPEKLPKVISEYKKFINNLPEMVQNLPEVRQDNEITKNANFVQDILEKNKLWETFNAIRLFGIGNAKDMFTKDGLYNFSLFNYLLNDLVHKLPYSSIKKLEQVLSRRGTDSQMIKKVINTVNGYVTFGEPKLLEDALDKIIEKQSKNIPLSQIYNDFQYDFFNTFIKQVDLSDEYISQTPKVIQKWDLEHFPGLSYLYNNTDIIHQKWLKSLVKSTYTDDYKGIIFDTETDIGKINNQTRNMFKNAGLDFNQWMAYKPENSFSFTAEYQQQLEGIKKFIDDDISFLLTSSEQKNIINFINNLKLSSIDKKVKLIIENGTLKTTDGSKFTRDTLQDFVGKFSNYLSDPKDNIWSKLKQNNETDFLDLKDHFKARLKGLKELKSAVNMSNNGNLKIRLWKRQPGHDLFQGDYCQCCISPTGVNNKSIIDSLMHTVDQIVELVDAKGNTVGKTKVLWIKDMSNDGKPALLANGFEMSTGYQNSLQIRKAMTEYLKEYARAVAPNQNKINIYTGQTYQKIPIDDLKEVKINARLIGNVKDNTYHLDSFSTTQGTSWPKNLDRDTIPLALRVLDEA